MAEGQQYFFPLKGVWKSQAPPKPGLTVDVELNEDGAGFYGLLAILSLAGPFLAYFWKDKLAVLGGILPLLFMCCWLRSGETPDLP